MTPERWQRIDALYHRALDCPPERRVAFLAEACAGDDEVRSEVESLLDQTGSVLRTRTIEHSTGLAAGSLLGPYRIEASIGAGGMGEVFRATDTRLHRTVAVKILSPQQIADPRHKKRFLQEARAVSALSHPNIVTLHDIASENGVDYLVMEYVPGDSLDKLIKPGGMPPDDVLRYAIQIAGALTAAHAAGIVHRDIKPANVIVAAKGQVKVLDFGLAKPEARAPDGDQSLTQAGMVVGTPAYMSPEQARGGDLDGRTDLFSFGALLYEMATGQRAFSRAFDWTAPPAGALPATLKPIVLKLLQADREKRFRNAAEVERELRRIGEPRTSPAIRWALVSSATVCMAAAAYFIFLHSPLSASRLTNKDTIVLADFVNRTGDPVFDDTLHEGLAIELQQSPFLSLIPDRRVRETLTLMGLPPDAHVTSEVAQQVCERVGSAAVLEGSLVKVGSSYILGLHAKRCESGNELFAEQAKVQKKEEVLDALSSVGKQFRIKAGEALSQVKEHSTPLPEATTGSLDALKAFATAMKIANTSGDPEALPWYRRATERDPRFAMAWADLGLAWSNLAEPQLSAESTTMAWKLRNRASQRERYFIDFTYDRQVTGDLEKAYSTLEQWAREYPRGDQPQPQGLLGGLSARGTGRFEQCAEYSKQEVEIDPTQVYGYGNVAVCEFDLNRFDQANAWLDLAAERKLTTPEELVLRYAIAFGKGDRAGMERIAASAEGKKISDHWMLYSQGFVLAHDGRLRMARIKVREAEELADREGQTGPAANYRAAMAVQEALYGNLAQAKADAEAALRRSHSRDVEFASAFALALSGDAARARQLADDLDKRFPEDTFVRFTYLPDLRALADLSRHQPARAVDHLQAAVPYENAANGLSFYFYLGAKHSNYLRGQAYLEQKEYAEAAAEFRKILAHTGLVYADPIGVLSHLQLGRALRMSGDQAQAKAEYEKFFSIWKDADTDNPVLIQAKAEYKRYFGAVI